MCILTVRLLNCAMQKFTRKLSIVLLVALVGCATRTTQQLGDTETLAGLKAMAYTKKSGARATAMTTSKIRERDG